MGFLPRICRIRGHAEALEQAIEGDTPCAALLQQIVAMRGATNGLMTQAMESYLRGTYGRDAPQSSVEADIDETMQILRTYFK